MKAVRLISLILLHAALIDMSSACAVILPDEAFSLLAEASVDPCSICAKQKVEKAFTILTGSLVPGLALDANEECLFKKAGQDDEFELSLSCYPSEKLVKILKERETLPRIVLKFYSQDKHLVGISRENYTPKSITDLYRSSPKGAVFVGSLRLIPYKYGDGPTYNYFLQENKLLIHCVVMRLKAYVPQETP